MSITEQAQRARIATVGDCGRLWRTLTKEYIPDLRIQLIPLGDDEEVKGLRIEVVSDGVMDPDAGQVEDVWASASFFNQLNLISVGALFELLIAAHRRIDGYFSIGERSAPARRSK